MVNSTSFDTNTSIGPGDRNPTKACTPQNSVDVSIRSTASRTSPRQKNLNVDALSSSEVAVSSKTQSEEKNLTESAVVAESSAATEDGNTLCCSVPLDKVQGVLTTFHHPKCDEPKPTRKLLCLYCERTFASANLRQKHVERIHSIKKNRRLSSRKQQLTVTPCIYCEKLNGSENTLKELFQHLVDEHASTYFGCLPCEERFLTSTSLNDHHAALHPTVEIPKTIVKLPIDDEDEEEKEEEEEEEDTTSVKLTRSRMKPKLETAENSKKLVSRTKNAKLKELRSKKMTVKSSRIALTRRESKRLQALTKLTQAQKKKRQKPVERKLHSANKTEIYQEKVKPTSICVNPYPEFDNFYRVKKITDHSIDNLKISSLTFDDVFDKAFFNRIKCNIEENLLHHIDGKLFKNEESESRISNFEKVSSVQQEVQSSSSENYGCELSLNAVTPVAALSLNSQFGEDFEYQIEYGSKPSKKKTQTKKDEVHYKYFTRRKFQASILEHKENRDLSKLDMWTQLVIKKRQQKIIDDKKTAKEILEYNACDEYKNKVRREELNRILDRRGPFEDLREEASKKAALDKLNSVSEEDSISHESFTEVREVLNDILSRVFAVTEESTDVVKQETNIQDSDQTTKISHTSDKLDSKSDLREIPSFLNLRRTSSLPTDGEIDQSDRITLICSSQETENFELPTNATRGKNELIELSGEWARCRMYICAACGAKLPNMKYLLDHKTIYHQNVWVQHYEFVGNQSELYRHLSIPMLGKVGYVEDNVACKAWKRSDARVCSKCKKRCNSLGELHRHILECGGDWTWVLVRKKCKYRYGAKSRRRRRGMGMVLKVHTKRKTDSTEKKTYKYDGPRQRPSDAETIQRMLANLPAKRSTRKLMAIYDGVRRRQKSKELENAKQKKVKCGKMIYNKPSNIKETTEKTINTAVPLKKPQRNNKSSNVRSLRSLSRVLSSRILDTSTKLTVKRKLKVLNERRKTRQSKIAEENKQKESNEDLSKPANETKNMNAETSEDLTPKRTSPRSTKMIRKMKLYTGNINIKSFFPVKKRKDKKGLQEHEQETKDIQTRNKKKSNEMEEESKKAESSEEKVVPKVTKSDRLSTLVRSLSVNKKKNLKKASQDKQSEDIAQEVPKKPASKEELELTKRKRKLKQSFRNVINRVKRLKIDTAPETVQTQVTEKSQPSAKSPFLDESIEKGPQVKIVIPSNLEAKENIADISETVHTVITFNESNEDSPVPENIFKLDSNNEKSLQAKGEPNFDTQSTTQEKTMTEHEIEFDANDSKLQQTVQKTEKLEPISIETSLKSKVVPMISPNLKGKIRKPARGLNDCIAMLTSKLQQKTTEVSPKPTTLNVLSPNSLPKIVTDPSPQTAECILKIPIFKNDHSEDVALDLSTKSRNNDSEQQVPLKLTKTFITNPKFVFGKDSPWDLGRLTSVERIIENVVSNKFQEPLKFKMATHPWNSIDQTIQNVIDDHIKQKTVHIRTTVDEIIDYVINFRSSSENNNVCIPVPMEIPKALLPLKEKPRKSRKLKKLESNMPNVGLVKEESKSSNGDIIVPETQMDKATKNIEEASDHLENVSDNDIITDTTVKSLKHAPEELQQGRKGTTNEKIQHQARRKLGQTRKSNKKKKDESLESPLLETNIDALIATKEIETRVPSSRQNLNDSKNSTIKINNEDEPHILENKTVVHDITISVDLNLSTDPIETKLSEEISDGGSDKIPNKSKQNLRNFRKQNRGKTVTPRDHVDSGESIQGEIVNAEITGDNNNLQKSSEDINIDIITTGITSKICNKLSKTDNNISKKEIIEENEQLLQLPGVDNTALPNSEEVINKIAKEDHQKVSRIGDDLADPIIDQNVSTSALVPSNKRLILSFKTKRKKKGTRKLRFTQKKKKLVPMLQETPFFEDVENNFGGSIANCFTTTTNDSQDSLPPDMISSEAVKDINNDSIDPLFSEIPQLPKMSDTKQNNKKSSPIVKTKSAGPILKPAVLLSITSILKRESPEKETKSEHEATEDVGAIIPDPELKLENNTTSESNNSQTATDSEKSLKFKRSDRLKTKKKARKARFAAPRKKSFKFLPLSARSEPNGTNLKHKDVEHAPSNNIIELSVDEKQPEVNTESEVESQVEVMEKENFTKGFAEDHVKVCEKISDEIQIKESLIPELDNNCQQSNTAETDMLVKKNRQQKKNAKKPKKMSKKVRSVQIKLNRSEKTDLGDLKNMNHAIDDSNIEQNLINAQETENILESKRKLPKRRSKHVNKRIEPLNALEDTVKTGLSLNKIEITSFVDENLVHKDATENIGLEKNSVGKRKLPNRKSKCANKSELSDIEIKNTDNEDDSNILEDNKLVAENNLEPSETNLQMPRKLTRRKSKFGKKEEVSNSTNENSNSSETTDSSPMLENFSDNLKRTRSTRSTRSLENLNKFTDEDKESIDYRSLDNIKKSHLTKTKSLENLNFTIEKETPILTPLLDNLEPKKSHSENLALADLTEELGSRQTRQKSLATLNTDNEEIVVLPTVVETPKKILNNLEDESAHFILPNNRKTRPKKTIIKNLNKSIDKDISLLKGPEHENLTKQPKGRRTGTKSLVNLNNLMNPDEVEIEKLDRNVQGVTSSKNVMESPKNVPVLEENCVSESNSKIELTESLNENVEEETLNLVVRTGLKARPKRLKISTESTTPVDNAIAEELNTKISRSRIRKQPVDNLDASTDCNIDNELKFNDQDSCSNETPSGSQIRVRARPIRSTSSRQPATPQENRNENNDILSCNELSSTEVDEHILGKEDSVNTLKRRPKSTICVSGRELKTKSKRKTKSIKKLEKSVSLENIITNPTTVDAEESVSVIENKLNNFSPEQTESDLESKIRDAIIKSISLQDSTDQNSDATVNKTKDVNLDMQVKFTNIVVNNEKEELEEEDSIFEDEIRHVVERPQKKIRKDTPKHDIVQENKNHSKEPSNFEPLNIDVFGVRRTRSSNNVVTSSNESLSKLNDSLDAEVSKIMGFSEFTSPDPKTGRSLKTRSASLKHIFDTSPFSNSSESESSPQKPRRVCRKSKNFKDSSVLSTSEESLNTFINNSEISTPAGFLDGEFVSHTAIRPLRRSKSLRKDLNKKETATSSIITDNDTSENDTVTTNITAEENSFKEDNALDNLLQKSGENFTSEESEVKLLEEKIRNAIRKSLMSISYDNEDEENEPIKPDDSKSTSTLEFDTSSEANKAIKDTSEAPDNSEHNQDLDPVDPNKKPKRSRKSKLNDPLLESKTNSTSLEIDVTSIRSRSRSLRRKSNINYAEIEETKEAQEDEELNITDNKNDAKESVINHTEVEENNKTDIASDTLEKDIVELNNSTTVNDFTKQTANDDSRIDDKKIDDEVDLKNKENNSVLKENLSKNTLPKTNNGMNKNRVTLRAKKGKRRFVRKLKTDATIPEVDIIETLPDSIPIISENIVSVASTDSPALEQTSIEKEPPIKIIINKHKARRKSKNIKKVGLKAHNDLYEDFALVIKKKHRAPIITFSPPGAFSKEDTYPMEVHHLQQIVQEPKKLLDDTVEEMDMELDEIPIKTNIIETLKKDLPLVTPTENEPNHSEIVHVLNVVNKTSKKSGKKKKGRSKYNKKSTTAKKDLVINITENSIPVNDLNKEIEQIPVIESLVRNFTETDNFFSDDANGNTSISENLETPNKFVLDKDDFSSDDFEVDNSFEDSIIFEDSTPKKPSVDAETLFNKLIENTEFVKPLVLKKTKILNKKGGRKTKIKNHTRLQEKINESTDITSEDSEFEAISLNMGGQNTSKDKSNNLDNDSVESSLETKEIDSIKEESQKLEGAHGFLISAKKLTKRAKKRGRKKSKCRSLFTKKIPSENVDDPNKETDITEEILQTENKFSLNYDEGLTYKKLEPSYTKADDLRKEDIDKLYAFSETEDFELERPIELPRRLPRKNDNLEKNTDYKDDIIQETSVNKKVTDVAKILNKNIEEKPELNFSGVFRENENLDTLKTSKRKSKEIFTIEEINDLTMDLVGRKSMRSAKVKALENIHDEALAQLTDTDIISDKKIVRESKNDMIGSESKKPNKKAKKADKTLNNIEYSEDAFINNEALADETTITVDKEQESSTAANGDTEETRDKQVGQETKMNDPENKRFNKKGKKGAKKVDNSEEVFPNELLAPFTAKDDDNEQINQTAVTSDTHMTKDNTENKEADIVINSESKKSNKKSKKFGKTLNNIELSNNFFDINEPATNSVIDKEHKDTTVLSDLKRMQKKNDSFLESFEFPREVLVGSEAPLLEDLVAELNGLEELENSIERELNAEIDLQKENEARDEQTKNEPVLEHLNSLDNNIVGEDNQELRRSRRAGSRKVASYNENDLIDPLIDALENKRTNKKKDDKISLEAKKRKDAEKKLNSEELFDLLKASTNDNLYVPKQQNAFLNSLEDSSRDVTDDNFDNMFENMFEKTALLTKKKGDLDQIYDFAESSKNIDSLNDDESKAKVKKSKKLDDIESVSISQDSTSESKSRNDKLESNYCEICNKSFVKIENLIKHRRTLTHIQKLSEIEAKEAEKSKIIHRHEGDNSSESVIEPPSLPDNSEIEKSNLEIGDILTTKDDIQSHFNTNHSLKLADIISDVLNKPVLPCLDEESNKFSDIILQNNTKRYKSLGERKSFDSDSLIASESHLGEPFEAKSTKTILEKQISLLENIIENQTTNNYIDDISLTSEKSDIPSEPSSPVMPEPLKDNDSFLKPTQYEEISEDSANLRNYDDQKLRKTLNRDEELFLECCSLLKSSSEVSSSYSNKKPHGKAVGALRLKLVDEPEWMKKKNLLKKTDSIVADDYSDNSRIPTPLGNSYDDYASNSNTISSNWGMDKSANDKRKSEGNTARLSFENITEKVQQDIGSTRFEGILSKERIEGLTNDNDPSRKNSSDELSDASLNDKKIMTKGARKVFEGLKVSIPTEEINLEEVLNNSPRQKKVELVLEKNIDEEKLCSPPSKRKSKPVKKAQVGSNLLFKVSKKKLPSPNITKDQKNERQFDVYDFEETQDNTDVFTKPNYRTFKNSKTGENESEGDSGDFIDSFEEPEALAPTTNKKTKAQENITKKKCMIMGRIFKNAAKSKVEDIDEEIRTIPAINNEELVENYVADCKKIIRSESLSTKNNFKLGLPETEETEKLTVEKVNLEKDPKLTTKLYKTESKKLENKKKIKLKGKKRLRTNSDSTDDEFSLSKTTKRKTNRKNAKEEDNCINLEQELKECIGVASRKSQRKCTSGKQNVLVEYWSSDDSQFEALLEKQIIEIKPKLQTIEKPPESTNTNIQPETEPLIEPKKTVQKKKSEKKKSKSHEQAVDGGGSNRRKRAAVNPLYHWSSSSEDEASDLIEVKPVRDEIEDDEDRPVQHGWIVGDSPKKLVTMLAQAKGKKADIDCVKEQSKKRTNTVS